MNAIKVLYPEDEFSITYNAETKEKLCIGFCMQCPLYLEYAKSGYDRVDCDTILYQKAQGLG